MKTAVAKFLDYASLVSLSRTSKGNKTLLHAQKVNLLRYFSAIGECGITHRQLFLTAMQPGSFLGAPFPAPYDMTPRQALLIAAFKKGDIPFLTWITKFVPKLWWDLIETKYALKGEEKTIFEFSLCHAAGESGNSNVISILHHFCVGIHDDYVTSGVAKSGAYQLLLKRPLKVSSLSKITKASESKHPPWLFEVLANKHKYSCSSL